MKDFSNEMWDRLRKFNLIPREDQYQVGSNSELETHNFRLVVRYFTNEQLSKIIEEPHPEPNTHYIDGYILAAQEELADRIILGKVKLELPEKE